MEAGSLVVRGLKVAGHELPGVLFRPLSIVLILVAIFLLGSSAAYGGIASSKHNFSITGPGPVKSSSEEQICVFCHTPHIEEASPEGLTTPLWNHSLSKADIKLYESSTLVSPTSPSIQPDGASKLCLSCHDGTVAVAAVMSGSGANGSSSIALQGATVGGVIPEGSSNLGTDLSGHHPISIGLDSLLINDKKKQCDDNHVTFKLCQPGQGSRVLLAKTKNSRGGSGMGVQCTSCHDPHNDPVPGKTAFLRVGDRERFEGLCISCHRDCSDSCL